VPQPDLRVLRLLLSGLLVQAGCAIDTGPTGQGVVTDIPTAQQPGGKPDAGSRDAAPDAGSVIPVVPKPAPDLDATTLMPVPVLPAPVIPGMREVDAGVVVPSTDGGLLELCWSDADCSPAAPACYLPQGAQPGFCTVSCSSGSDCPALAGVPSSCSSEGMCRVDCAGSGVGDGACPAPLRCRELPAQPPAASIYRCTYPAGSGSHSLGKLERCDQSHGDGDCAAQLACRVPHLGPTVPEPQYGYCAPLCSSNEECKLDSGSALGICSYAACEYECSAGRTCPSGMRCLDIGTGALMINRCRYLP
jgi:hypothetical protein